MNNKPSELVRKSTKYGFISQDMKDKIDVAIVGAFDQKNQTTRIAEGVAAASTKQCLNPLTYGSQQILLSDM